MPPEVGSVRPEPLSTLLVIDHLIAVWRDLNPEKLLEKY